MAAAWKIVGYLLALVVIAGCRKNDIVADGGSPGPSPVFNQRLSFSATGVTGGSSRTYSKVSAVYDASANETTIETLDDSVVLGKFVMRFHGSMAGMYVYDVKGSPVDLNQVYMRFVPSYNGLTPSAVFELTNAPDDSLQAEVIVQHYGAVRDSINGEFSAMLRLTAPAMNFKTLLHSGSFTAQRLE